MDYTDICITSIIKDPHSTRRYTQKNMDINSEEQQGNDRWVINRREKQGNPDTILSKEML